MEIILSLVKQFHIPFVVNMLNIAVDTSMKMHCLVELELLDVVLVMNYNHSLHCIGTVMLLRSFQNVKLEMMVFEVQNHQDMVPVEVLGKALMSHRECDWTQMKLQ